VALKLRVASSRLAAGVCLAALALFAPASLSAWNAQGHRLVALVATNHLTPAARQQVRALLGDDTLADVAVWADRYLLGNNQTSFWHYVNIPPDAASYDRDRDCPRQPGVAAGGRGDAWRDCVVDRIRYNQERLADASFDRADRAIALKFLVHLVGDVHQPLHALGVERGGNGIRVSVFGSAECRYDDGTPYPCNLHGVWDTELIGRRRLGDQPYVAELERIITQRSWSRTAIGSPDAWAMESHTAARRALLPAQSVVDDAYYRAHIATVDERLALGGWRLASLVNQALDRPAQ
jgi:S1/P1 Nuclease